MVPGAADWSARRCDEMQRGEIRSDLAPYSRSGMNRRPAPKAMNWLLAPWYGRQMWIFGLGRCLVLPATPCSPPRGAPSCFSPLPSHRRDVIVTSLVSEEALFPCDGACSSSDASCCGPYPRHPGAGSPRPSGACSACGLVHLPLHVPPSDLERLRDSSPCSESRRGRSSAQSSVSRLVSSPWHSARQVHSSSTDGAPLASPERMQVGRHRDGPPLRCANRLWQLSHVLSNRSR